MSSSSQTPSVPPITSMRGYVDTVNELRDLVPSESQHRMYDLLAAIVGYVEDGARKKALREAIEAARAEYLADNTGRADDAAYNDAVGHVIASSSALTEGGAS